MDCKTIAATGLGTPKPCEDVGRHDRYPSSCGDARKSLLRAGFSVRERVAADHDSDKVGSLGNRSR